MDKLVAAIVETVAVCSQEVKVECKYSNVGDTMNICVYTAAQHYFLLADARLLVVKCLIRSWCRLLMCGHALHVAS